MDDETLGKLLAEGHRDYAEYRSPECVSVSPSSMSVMVDRTGKPLEKSDIDQRKPSSRPPQERKSGRISTRTDDPDCEDDQGEPDDKPEV